MTDKRLRIDRLIEQKIEDRHKRIVEQKVDGYITLEELVHDVMADAKFSKHLALRSGTIWEDELVWGRYVRSEGGRALRAALGFHGTRQWESYVVPRTGSSARHTRWVPVAVMMLFQIKRSADQKVRLGRATLAQGLYLRRLAIECEARGISDQMSVRAVYEDAAQAAVEWMKRSA